MTKWRDRAFSLVEYLIIFAFGISSISLINSAPIDGDGFVVSIFGGRVALFVYMIWFAFLALTLLWAKLTKHRTWHRNVLMAIYLTCIYTAILTIHVFGFGEAIDDIVIGLLAGGCWLRWKFKTEYVSYDNLSKEWHEKD